MNLYFKELHRQLLPIAIGTNTSNIGVCNRRYGGSGVSVHTAALAMATYTSLAPRPAGV